MRVLAGCEYSGIVRDAFIKAGHDAISCDLLPTESPGPHYQGDIFDIIDDGFDLAVLHPPCTRLCNSGVRWLDERNLWDEMKEGAEFFKRLLDSNIPMIAVENPVPHKYALQIIGRGYDQTIQPWQFGHTTSKRTCLWLKNLPPLVPTNIIPKEFHTQDIHLASPGKNRSKIRSRFYEGIAEAMANQWGSINKSTTTSDAWPIHPYVSPAKCLCCGTTTGTHTGPHYSEDRYALYNQHGKMVFDSMSTERTLSPAPRNGEQLKLF